MPVSEKLPEDNSTVLVTIHFFKYTKIEFGQYSDGKWFWLNESSAGYWEDTDDVVAWMPLPEPYKGVK